MMAHLLRCFLAKPQRFHAVYARTIKTDVNPRQRDRAILHIPKANVYRFGDSDHSVPVFKDLEWTVTEGQSWAVVGPAGNEKSMLFDVSN